MASGSHLILLSISSLTPLQSLCFSLSGHLSGNLWNSGTNLLSTLCVCMVTFFFFFNFHFTWGTVIPSITFFKKERMIEYSNLSFFNILVREPIHGYDDFNDQLFTERYILHPIQVPLRVCKNTTANGRIIKAG